MMAVNIKEIVGLQKQGTRENRRKCVCEVKIFLVPKLISALIDGSEVWFINDSQYNCNELSLHNFTLLFCHSKMLD